VNSRLLFAGTEFGVYFTTDAGAHWIKLKGGMPTISVRDIAIQERENDLVLATFGRGIYILDDYTPLRAVNEEYLEREASLFPVKDALRYVQTSRLGGRSGKGSQGAAYYAAANPPFGAVFTYYLKDKITTRKERRQEAEKKARKEGSSATYPTIDELRAEDEEKEPKVVLIVADESGQLVRRVTGPREKGIHRVAWDLRYPSAEPTELKPPKDRPPWARPPVGPLALPGTYKVTLAQEVDGMITSLAEPREFEVVPLELATFAAQDRREVMAFRKKVARLQRAVRGAVKAAEEAHTRLGYLRKAFVDTPAADPALLAETEVLEQRLNRLLVNLRGDRTRSKRMEPAPPSINQRVRRVVSSQWRVTSAPTQTQRDAYVYAGREFTEVLAKLRVLLAEDLAGLEAKLEEAGAPWTPGRLPDWDME
ncbi:MAG: glycosyl hydrolase, partial [Planctomycetota bacterium]|jgi:hypothetical protein